MRNFISYKCNIVKKINRAFLSIIILLCLTGCSQQNQGNQTKQLSQINQLNPITPTIQINLVTQTPEMEEKSVTTVYEDESQKEIVYGELRFEISPYHITTKEEWNSFAEFYCELDSEEDWTKKSKFFRIEKCSDNGVVTFKDAKKYFEKISEFESIESYQNIQDESGIIKMYEATLEEGLSYYMCYFQKETYLITVEDQFLTLDLIKKSILDWDWEQEAQYTYNIDTKNQFTKKVIENRICYEDFSSYEIYSKDGSLEYKAELTIEPRKTEDYGFSYFYRIYDTKNKEVQCLEWESTVIEYPKFVDLNQDGSVDMQVVVDQAPSYNFNDFFI